MKFEKKFYSSRQTETLEHGGVADEWWLGKVFLWDAITIKKQKPEEVARRLLELFHMRKRDIHEYWYDSTVQVDGITETEIGSAA